MNRTEELYGKYLDTKAELYKVIIEDIKTMLSAFSNNRLVFDEMDEEIYDEYTNNMYTSVSYDGGNHPEYASNCFSEVHGAFLDEDGEVYLIIDDCDEYEIRRVWSMEELKDVYDAIKFFVENK